MVKLRIKCLRLKTAPELANQLRISATSDVERFSWTPSALGGARIWHWITYTLTAVSCTIALKWLCIVAGTYCLHAISQLQIRGVKELETAFYKKELHNILFLYVSVFIHVLNTNIFPSSTNYTIIDLCSLHLILNFPIIHILILTYLYILIQLLAAIK